LDALVNQEKKFFAFCRRAAGRLEYWKTGIMEGWKTGMMGKDKQPSWMLEHWNDGERRKA